VGYFSDKTVTYMQDISDTEVAAIIWADVNSTNTAPTIEGSSADLLGTTDGTTTADAFTDITVGTSGTIDTAQVDVDTMGELADRINEGCSGWHMELIGACRGDTSASILDTITEQACGGRENAVIIPWDTSEAKAYYIGLTPRRWAQIDYDEPGSDGEYINEIISLSVTSTFASGTSYLYVYEVDHRMGAATEKMMFYYPLTTATAFTLEPYDIQMQSDMGKSLVVKLDNSTQAVDAQLIVKARHFLANPALRRG